MKNTKILCFSTLLLLLISAFSTGGQHQTAAITTESEDGITWISWEEAMAKNEVEKKKIIVDLYTDWCGWCKRMDQTTFQDKEIVAYVNANYYAIKFNGEQEQSITVGEKTYEFVESEEIKGVKGYHELAQALSMGRLTYPTVVFLNEDGKILQPLSGYKDAATFEMIMTYFGGNFYQSTPWDMYQESYVPLRKQK